ncbi:MAG TPA: lysophospholipid acyltransferase family protein [Pyrinomonadaceae bacterium]|nr:lysophospholipid acyltransferase family protein [Pyrinomonadaceae bacterium]
MLRRVITAVLRFALRVFFRRIEVVGRERVPRAGACLFVLNHPNALVDPVFLLCFAPRRVSFLAKSPLFRMPVIGFFVRALDSIPVYRRQDEGADTSRNRETFSNAAALLRRGGTIAICPEGASHSEPYLLPLKTGAARIALGAASVKEDGGMVRAGDGATGRPREEPNGKETPRASHVTPSPRPSVPPSSLSIVPVGLYYTAKTTFRSGALLYFGEPIAVRSVEPDEQGEPPREAVRELSDRIAERLRSLTLNADRHEALAVVARAERVFSSEEEEEEPSLERELRRRRRFVEGYAFHRRHSPERLEVLEKRIRQYEEELTQAGIEDPRQLSAATVSEYARAPTILSRVLLFALFAPLAAAGTALHYPAYTLAGTLATKLSREGDDVLSTFKIAAAMLLFPLTWVALALSLYTLAGWRVALGALVCAPLSGYVALRTREEFDRFVAGARVALFFVRERSFFRRLLEERRHIRREILALGDEAERAGALTTD